MRQKEEKKLNGKRATAEASPNIAIIKYWGKRNEKLILPVTESLSVTLDEKLKTRTTVMFSEKFKEDEVYLGYGKKLKKLKTAEELEKIIPQLNVVRELAKTDLRAKVVSVSSVPVAAGLAGSSAGLSATALAASLALDLKLDKKELSILSRRGSGSACRSLFGGFVRWQKGEKEDGSDSFAYQIKDEKFWPEFRIIIGLIEEKEKKIKSRAGMRQTAATSLLYQKRIENLPKLIEETNGAILKKDHQKLFEIAMREANNLHAVMLDTWPPIIYLNDLSKKVIEAILDFNKEQVKAGYTFDAGPNPIIFTLQEFVPKIKKILQSLKIKKIIVSKIGPDPRFVQKEHLISEKGAVSKNLTI